MKYVFPLTSEFWKNLICQFFNNIISPLYNRERNSKTIKYCGDKIPYSIYSHEGVIKIRVVAASSSDGGVFQFEALARKRDFGSDCL